MPTSDRRGDRRDPEARPADSSGAADAPDNRDLLARILETPQLAQVVPRLQPEVLHRVIETCGLEDCGELVALATPGQLERVFDLDLWRPPQPGLDEELDADRFAVWLEVLMASGEADAAQKLASMEAELVISALAAHLRVFDLAAVSYMSLDGEEVHQRRGAGDQLECEIGGYLVVARRTTAWDTIISTLIVLEAEQPAYFHRVMAGCRRLSDAGAELDGLDHLLPDREQEMFELTIDRERRREKQGYMTPPQARAFLQMAREIATGPGTAPPISAIAQAYFRSIEPPSAVDEDANEQAGFPSPSPDSPQSPPANDAGAIIDLLREAGCVPQAPRALLEAPHGETARLGRIQTLMHFAAERDYSAYSTRAGELAYLANTIVAGCSIQARPFTAQEASDAAVAICNLGLENWPSHWLGDRAGDESTPLPEDFLISQDLVAPFQVGWSVLHRQVAMHTAEQLIHVLAGLRTTDRETQAGLDTLRFEMTRQWRAGTPWRARDALEILVILHMPAWAVLLGLIDECPVFHAMLRAAHGSRTRSVSASAFEFISEGHQIAAIHQYLESLPETLRS
jgi:hypothetical protein